MANAVVFETDGFTDVEAGEVLVIVGEGTSSTEMRPLDRSGALADVAGIVIDVLIAGAVIDYLSAVVARLIQRFSPTILIDLRGTEPKVRIVRQLGAPRGKTLVLTGGGDEIEVVEGEGAPQLPEVLRELLK